MKAPGKKRAGPQVLCHAEQNQLEDPHKLLPPVLLTGRPSHRVESPKILNKNSTNKEKKGQNADPSKIQEEKEMTKF